MPEPLVSVVTPFHNTANYLEQCIQSVLAQSYPHFEYILLDNCSTDGSGEIAEKYARLDSRIRWLRNSRLLPQVQNYNRAIAEISQAGRYLKLVQADDSIFPLCLELMVRAFEESESIGLVSSYWLKGNQVRGSGFSFPSPVVRGQEMARDYLRTGVWVFGSPTAVMYRSCLARNGKPFYDESKLHEDTDKCMEILERWDFGFVHQILSFSRADNESISSAVRDFLPGALDRYIIVRRYADTFLEREEAAALRDEAKRVYYRALAHQAFRLREKEFWKYHQAGLNTLGESLDRGYLRKQIIHQGLWMAANPGTTAALARRFWKRKMKPEAGRRANSRHATP